MLHFLRSSGGLCLVFNGSSCIPRVTSAYLACKVEEFNVSIDQFIANIKGDKGRAMDIVLNNELLLMRELNFHLTIHNPFRPVEGLLIDVKV